jgi:RNA polymerase sigma-70 factor (sigma-E family)
VEEDLAAFTAFAAARYRSLARSAYLLVGDRGHAEDLVQAALYRTFTAWSRLHAPEAAESYTRTTMIRLAGRWSRRRWRGEVPHAEPVTLSTACTAVDERALALRVALQSLPRTQRAALVLRFFDDLSEAETAKVLGCPPGTVKSRVSRGLERLRALDVMRADHATGVHDG